MSLLGSLIASTAGDGETSSSTIFYIVGGALAVWAVLISAIGIARPNWPGQAGARVLMLLTALLVAGAASTAVITS
jgi:hypothetical protein